MLQVEQTLMAQYANSTKLCALIGHMNAAFDPRSLFDLFYDQIWNINTAIGYGLDIWGRIVGVPRLMPFLPVLYFGFNGQGLLTARPFDQAPYYDGEWDKNTYITLDDEAYRALILVKAFTNLSNASISDMNRILRLLFGIKDSPNADPYWTAQRRAWISDNQDMSLTVNFTWTPTAYEASTLINSGIFPRPAGVLFTYKIHPDYSKMTFFGFVEANEPRYRPFDVESFYHNQPINNPGSGMALRFYPSNPNVSSSPITEDVANLTKS